MTEAPLYSIRMIHEAKREQYQYPSNVIQAVVGFGHANVHNSKNGSISSEADFPGIMCAVVSSLHNLPVHLRTQLHSRRCAADDRRSQNSKFAFKNRYQSNELPLNFT